MGLYELCMAALTFASSFMAADTVIHVLRLQKDRIATIFFGIWLVAAALTVVDEDWLSTLGFGHVILFLGCFVVEKTRSDASAIQEKDYIMVPTRLYVPLYLAVCFIRYWAE